MSLRKTDPDSQTSASASDQPAVKQALARGFPPDIRFRTLADWIRTLRSTRVTCVAPTWNRVRTRMSLRKTDPDSQTSASASDQPAGKTALAHGFPPDIRFRTLADWTRTSHRPPSDASHRPASVVSHRPWVACGPVCRSGKPIPTHRPQHPLPTNQRWKQHWPTGFLRTYSSARSQIELAPLAPTRVRCVAPTRDRMRTRMSLRKTDPDSRTSAFASDQPAVKQALAHGFPPDIRFRTLADW